MSTNSGSQEPHEASSLPIQTTQTSGRPTRSRTLWIAGLCMLAGAGYLFSQRGSANRAGGRGAPPPGGVPVSAESVQSGNMPVYISAIGTVVPVYTVTVTSRVAGELMQIYYKEGQIVEKGRLLAEIDPRPYEAVYVQAQGQLARDQAQLANARVDLQRYSMALAQHAVPEQTYLSAVPGTDDFTLSGRHRFGGVSRAGQDPVGDHYRASH